MSPEERAEAIALELEDTDDERVNMEKARLLIASAIREAEASARNEALERTGYSVQEPKEGFRPISSFTPVEKAKLRPMADTLALLDGNAFFGTAAGDLEEWSDQYLPEAAAVFDANGGDKGWAGASSFARALSDARNEALEEAAARCDWFAEQQMVPPISSYVEGRRDAGQALAGHILNLKTKD